jgi:hypothetical protein
MGAMFLHQTFNNTLVLKFRQIRLGGFICHIPNRWYVAKGESKLA